MQQRDTGTQWAARWVAGVQRRAGLVLAVAALVGAALMVLIARHLSVDTNTAHMLSAELPWRRAADEADRFFPRIDPSLAVVIDGPGSESLDAAQRVLVDALRTRPDLFSDVFAAETEPFFRRNGLLYLEPDALDKLANQLNLAQPFLGTLGRDPSLRGLSSLLVPALQRPDAVPFDLSPAFKALGEAVGAAVDGRSQPMSWQGVIGGDDAGVIAGRSTRRFIAATARRDFSQILPAAAAVDFIRTTVSQHQLDTAGLRVRLTGAAALEHEELQSAFAGTGIALGAAMLLVAVLLWLALRSLRLVLCAVLTLIYGLIATAGFAAAAVGHLNVISIAFGLLYVGLGIDYALYLCLQYRERLAQSLPSGPALSRAAGDVGGFMLVCALTTSVGFFAFIPTSFRGIAELGLIAGVGMFISLAVSLTLLPALIALLPVKSAPVHAAAIGTGVLDWPYRYARVIWIGAVALMLGALLLVTQARFDYDPLNVRDPNAESVSTFRDLQRDPSLPPLTLSALAADAGAANALARRLAALPEVARAFSLDDLVPADQDEKLSLIDDLALTLDLPAAVPVAVSAPPAPEIAAVGTLRDALSQRIAALPEADPARAVMLGLDAQLQRLQDAAAKAGGEKVLSVLRANLFDALPAQIDALRRSLQAGPVSASDLPPLLASRYRSQDGHYRVEIWPKAILDTPEAMERFVDSVRAVAPAATGAPVEFLESGRTVVQAFREAFVYSMLAVVVLLLVMLRSVRDMLLVLVPLLLAGLFTVAAMVLLRQPFNFANVIALPLVLGVGVDYGVYLVQRARLVRAGVNLLRTSTARAVWYGALITIANFGNLMLARHPGMASMGLLLTIGLCVTLLCTLVLLPSLLARNRG